jgi:hypothetical protein
LFLESMVKTPVGKGISVNFLMSELPVSKHVKLS